MQKAAPILERLFLFAKCSLIQPITDITDTVIPADMLNRIVRKPGHTLVRCEQVLQQQVIELLTGQVHVPCDLCPDRRILEMIPIGDFLDGLPDTGGETVKMTLRFDSPSGEKTAQFDYRTRVD